MTSRQTLRKLPRIWLMTDERFGKGLLDSIAALPKGSGVIFRHYSLNEQARRALFEEVHVACDKSGHMLLLAGTAEQAQSWGADGFHGPGRARAGQIHSMAVHDRREAWAARKARANLLFISPAFATTSHPGAATLGISGFRALAAWRGGAKAIALGGMNATRARILGATAYGWAAVDAFRIKRD